MSNDKKNVNNNFLSVLDTSSFLKNITADQKKYVSEFVAQNHKGLRKTVYISSGGKYYKYVDFILAFVYKLGFVPVHPILNLNYYISTIAHNYSKAEIVKDCFSLIDGCDELWVFDEALPGSKKLSDFPEGVLMEIYYWLSKKPNKPIRFFSWQDVGAPKYLLNDKWTLIKNQNEKENVKADHIDKFAVIDLGSSTVKLTLCEQKDDKNIITIFKKSMTVNLAENFFDKMTLGKNAIERTIQAILDFQKIALDYGIINSVVIGTGVLRKAVNIDEFLGQVKKDTGLSVRVISSKDEAVLLFKAVAASFNNPEQEMIVANAGGGSTEIIIGTAQKFKHYSIALGISNLNEKFVTKYPLPEAEYLKMKAHITKVLSESIKYKSTSKDKYLVYSGGELDYMIITGFPLQDLHVSLHHPKFIDKEGLAKYSRKMRTMNLEKLHGYMPANPAWMNGALASNTILETIAEYFNCQTVIPSNMNLNDGIILEMVE